MFQLESAAISKPGDSATNARLSGEVFGTLVNLSGRRRFTSQRVVLYAVLASMGHEGAIETSREALTLFRNAHTDLVKGNRELPGIFCDEIRDAYFGPLDGDKVIRKFIDVADQTLDAIKSGGPRAPALLNELLQSATPMLGVLNQITLVYEEQSKRHAKSMQKQLLGMMTDIKTIAKQARMVSFNAQIVAARAGDAGREFSVVAGVLTSITTEIDDLVHAAIAGSMN